MLPDDVHLDLRLDTERRYGNGMIGLVGRDGVLEDFVEALEDGPGASGRATLYTGAREATAPDGFDDSKVRTVAENATTLKFEQSGFEES